jgi:hypothetical protein
VVIVGIGRHCRVSYNRAMKPASRYFRWFLVASLSLSLVSGGFCSQTVMANCSAGEISHHTVKRCCCGDNCKCGAACPSRGGPDKSQQPTKATDNELRDLVKIAASFSIAVDDLPLRQQFCKPSSVTNGEFHAPQTLLEQHTCLQV